MRIDPAIAALRRDRAPQRQAQAAMVAACDAWRSEPGAAALLLDLERFGSGSPLDPRGSLGAIFSGVPAMPDAIASLCRMFCAAMAESPFGQPAIRHGFQSGHSSLLLARTGRAQLLLHGWEPGERERITAGFSDAVRFEAVLGGEARGRLLRREARSGRIDSSAIDLRPGVRLELDLAHEAVQVVAVDRRLVSLRLERSAERPGPSCEYTIADGALIHRSSPDLRASRQEMMLALLGRMERRESAPVMAAMAREEGPDSLRWEALRECLALDTQAGFQALGALACNAADPLAAAAGALRAQLLEAHPQLALIEEDRPCPA